MSSATEASSVKRTPRDGLGRRRDDWGLRSFDSPIEEPSSGDETPVAERAQMASDGFLTGSIAGQLWSSALHMLIAELVAAFVPMIEPTLVLNAAGTQGLASLAICYPISKIVTRAVPSYLSNVYRGVVSRHLAKGDIGAANGLVTGYVRLCVFYGLLCAVVFAYPFSLLTGVLSHGHPYTQGQWYLFISLFGGGFTKSLIAGFRGFLQCEGRLFLRAVHTTTGALTYILLVFSVFFVMRLGKIGPESYLIALAACDLATDVGLVAWALVVLTHRPVLGIAMDGRLEFHWRSALLSGWQEARAYFAGMFRRSTASLISFWPADLSLYLELLIAFDYYCRLYTGNTELDYMVIVLYLYLLFYQMSLFPALSFSAVFEVAAAANLARGNYARAAKFFKQAVGWALLVGVVVAGLLMVFAKGMYSRLIPSVALYPEFQPQIDSLRAFDLGYLPLAPVMAFAMIFYFFACAWAEVLHTAYVLLILTLYRVAANVLAVTVYGALIQRGVNFDQAFLVGDAFAAAAGVCFLLHYAYRGHFLAARQVLQGKARSLEEELEALDKVAAERVHAQLARGRLGQESARGIPPEEGGIIPAAVSD